MFPRNHCKSVLQCLKLLLSFLPLLLLHFHLAFQILPILRHTHISQSYVFCRNQDGYELNMLSDDEVEEDNESYYQDSDASSTIDNPQDFVGIWQSNQVDIDHDHEHEQYEDFQSQPSSESQQTAEDEEEEINEIPSVDSHADVIPWPTHQQPENPPINCHTEEETATIATHDQKFQTYKPPNKQQQEEENGIVYGDACTVGSISRDSSEWRDSSYTEDPFSSSSRRSCFKWESYPIFQKYEDEMLIFDKIIWEKLQESETLKYIQSRPKSMSRRIIRIFIPGSKNSSSTTNYHRRHYHELESAYVAQICLTWEALSWNYNYFCRLRASRRDTDPGCPAYVAQQFQQFQVLLQRYNETEPYEHGKRPEIYTRKRISSPKLLQVPEYRDSNDEHGSRIPSNSFLMIMEESIKTFIDFLKADKQSRISKVRIRQHPMDPSRVLLLKKEHKKKKRKVKEIRRGGQRWRFKKTRELKGEEEMEMLMSLTDLKVVERVLRMGYEFEYLSDEKIQWCEEKMKKVRLHNGKVKRDSSTSPPILFPAAASVHQHHH